MVLKWLRKLYWQTSDLYKFIYYKQFVYTFLYNLKSFQVLSPNFVNISSIATFLILPLLFSVSMLTPEFPHVNAWYFSHIRNFNLDIDSRPRLRIATTYLLIVLSRFAGSGDTKLSMERDGSSWRKETARCGLKVDKKKKTKKWPH